MGTRSTRRLRNSSVDGSTQCRSSMTKSIGCCVAMRNRIVVGLAASAASAARAPGPGGHNQRPAAGRGGRQREAPSRQWQAILHHEPLEFTQLLLRVSSRLNCRLPAPADRSSDIRRCSGSRANTGTASATPGPAATCSTSTWTRRDLPMPASPLSSTTCPIPSLTCPSAPAAAPLPAPDPRGCQAPAAHASRRLRAVLSDST